MFLFCVIALLVELIVMFHKHHFFSLLALMSVMAIFFLNYFDMHYMRFVLVTLAVSIILDILWIIVHTGVDFFLIQEYWNPTAESVHSNLQLGFLKFIVIIVIGLAFLKVPFQ